MVYVRVHVHVNTYATELALPSFCLLLKRGIRRRERRRREGEEIRETGWEVVCGTGGRHAGGFWSLVPPEVPATSDDKTKEAQEATARRRDSGSGDGSCE